MAEAPATSRNAAGPGEAPGAGAGRATITIDGRAWRVPLHSPIINKEQPAIDGRLAPTTIWDAARLAGVSIPALCHRQDLRAVGVCRMCVVEVEGDAGSKGGPPPLAAACMRTVTDGMVVHTASERVEEVRRTLTELLLAEHPAPCAREKDKPGSCELEALGHKYGLIEKPPAFAPRAFDKGTDRSNFSIFIDHSACIMCDRCVRACGEVAQENVIARTGKGVATAIGFDNDKPMGDSSCVDCGWCMISCPTGAITYGGGVPAKLKDGTPVDPEDLIRRLPSLFKGVSMEFLRRSQGSIVERRFKPGEIICRQGEHGHTAYLIEQGAVDIYLANLPAQQARTKARGAAGGGGGGGGGVVGRVINLLGRGGGRTGGTAGSSDGSERTTIPIDADLELDRAKPIARIGSLELIGEAACLNNQPRSATMRAVTDVVILEMARNVLEVLRRGKAFKAKLEKKYRARLLDNALRSSPLFGDLTNEMIDELGKRVTLVAYSPGEVIFRQGDPADALYLVRMGHVKVYEEVDGRPGQALNYLTRGQCFGELGLLADDPALQFRTRSCAALDHVELVRVPRVEFDMVMKRFPDVARRVRDRAEIYVKLGPGAPDPKRNVLFLEEFIEQGLYQAQSLLVLDLEKCTRCDECVRACAQAHGGQTRLLREGRRLDKYLVTTSCRSCHDPYCMVGCPVDAIHRKPGEKQLTIEDHCIGCGKCAENCPFGNIFMQEAEVEAVDLSTGKTVQTTQRRATVCDLGEGQCIGPDEDPACVYACPHDAALTRMNAEDFMKVVVGSANMAAGGKQSPGKGGGGSEARRP